jgi:5-methylcytosine-specific restriction protein A
MPAPTQAHQWDHLYDSRRWRRLAELHRKIEPCCRMCDLKGIVTAVEIVDHVTPHRGNMKLFYESELQSLCRRCHADKTNLEQGRRLRPVIGTDGWPIE